MASRDFLRIFSRLPGGPVARGAVQSIVIRVCATAFGFLQAALLARILGPEGYGVVAIATSASTVVAGIALLGLGNFSVREVSRLRAKAQFDLLRGFVIWSLIVVAVAGAAGGAALIALGRLPALALPREIFWGLWLTPLFSLLLLLRGIAQGLGSVFSSLAPTELLRPSLMVFFLFIVVISGASLTSGQAILLFVVSNIFALLYALFCTIGALSKFATSRLTARGAKWIKGSMPFFFFSIILMLHSESNTILLGSLVGPNQAGVFQPALRIAAVILIARYAIDVPLSPRISEFFETSRHHKLRGVVTRATLVATVATGTISLAVVVAAPWLLAAFGPEFVQSIPSLYWLALAHVFSVACGPVAQLLNMTGHQSLSALGLALGLVMNISMSVLLIPEYGATGAAVGMAAGLSLANGLMLWFVRRKLGFDPSILSSRDAFTRAA